MTLTLAKPLLLRTSLDTSIGRIVGSSMELKKTLIALCSARGARFLS
jgi:hypothetical protein